MGAEWIVSVISIIASATIAIVFIVLNCRKRVKKFEVVIVDSGLSTGDRVTFREVS